MGRLGFCEISKSVTYSTDGWHQKRTANKVLDVNRMKPLCEAAIGDVMCDY